MLEKLERGNWAAAFLALLVSAGCGGGETGGGGEEPAEEAGGGGPTVRPVDAATAGGVSGRVTFTGTPAAAEPIDMAEEAVCSAKHSTPPMSETAMVGADGGLANVFVYVKTGPVTTMQFPTPGEQVVLDQNGCLYAPHVMGLQAGQELLVRNSDDVLHNINATPTENRPFNRSQPQAGMEFTTSFDAPEVMIPVRCDVHGWMEAYIGVTSHPYHAVTSADGSFSLPNLPPGDYEVEAWHEVYGTLTQTVTVPASGAAEVTFAFNDQMAGRAVPMSEPVYVDHATGRLVPVATMARADLHPSR